LCDCHGEPKDWNANKNRRAGGSWGCAVRRRELQRARARGRSLKPRPDGDAPPCQCHGEPQNWHRHSGRWYCAVKHRKREENRRRLHGSPAVGSAEYNLLMGSVRRRGWRRGPDHHNWAGDEALYEGAHKRHRKALAGRPCAMQDESCRGKLHAALNHDADPSRLRVSHQGLSYSTDSAAYLVLCVLHHRRYDLAAGRVAGR
jgi:hypothetical protein